MIHANPAEVIKGDITLQKLFSIATYAYNVP